MFQREAKFKHQKQNELVALQKRVQTGREEQKKQRQMDLSVPALAQNVKSELEAQQNPGADSGGAHGVFRPVELGVDDGKEKAKRGNRVTRLQACIRGIMMRVLWACHWIRDLVVRFPTPPTAWDLTCAGRSKRSRWPRDTTSTSRGELARGDGGSDSPSVAGTKRRTLVAVSDDSVGDCLLVRQCEANAWAAAAAILAWS